MSLHTKVCLVVVGTFLASLLVQNECRKLHGYKFPVYATTVCPRNETEWIERSSALNCNKSNGYTCLPNENFDQLLEYCYIVPVERIQKGFCLYLVKRVSRTQSYSCRNFAQGCHNHSFFSNEIYKYPACISLGNGCFLAEPSCKSISPPHIQSTTQQFKNDSINKWNRSTNNDDDGALFAAILLGIFILLCILSLLSAYYMIRIRRRKNDVELHEEDEIGPLLDDKNPSNNGNDCIHELDECIPSSGIDMELHMEKSIFNQWEQDDSCFISTKAFKEVEKMIKSKNLVIVAGHSGSGKSAIIQHIALKYREQGWTVRRVKKVEDIVDEYSSSRFQNNKTICVFNDPLGKESFDEILNNSWQTHMEELELYLKAAKLVMSCRSHIIYDARLTRYLVNQSHVVNIDDKENKLSVQEKREILTKYTPNVTLSEEDCSKILEVETYFPLLCKLYSSKEEYKNKGIEFFTEPDIVLKEEILGFRKKDKGKYCALAFLVFFNDSFCARDLFKKGKDTKEKFKHTLKICGLSTKTAPSEIGDNLHSLKGLFVKEVGDTYYFYHDFVMEVTTYVLGTDYPTEIIKFADIGFLRRRVELGNCEEHSDSFTVYLNDRYKEDIGERLFTELIGERILDVVLNPCLRNQTVIEIIKKKISDHSEYIQKLLETKKLTVYKQDLGGTSENLLLTKLSFLNLEKEVSPLFALIVFCHTQLSQYCVNTLQQKQMCFLIPAIYCNGSIELFFNVFKDHGEETLEKTWGGLCPIHIVSVFHNYKLLSELIKIGLKVNQKTDDYGGWTPLMLAAGNNTEHGDYSHRETGAERRDETVQLLLSNGTDINLCTEDGASPLFIACQNGHDSTVQLLLRNGADINLCNKIGASSLYIACENGHYSTVQLLMCNGADINLCKKNGVSPLYIACQNGHDSTAQLLLSNGADINLCEQNGSSPLSIACFNGHDSTAQLLLSNGADINLCEENGVSPLYIACQNDHNSTVQLLLSNGADINLCEKNGVSPLHIACQNGHDSNVHLLLSNGADINLCEKNLASPLFLACFNGHDSTVELLLSNGADISLCNKNGASPHYIACRNGHDTTAQLLLSNGTDINLCKKNRVSRPLFIACLKGHDSTVRILLSNGVDINLCNTNGVSPLFLACQNGHDSTAQLLLSNGADINLCEENGVSPLYIACRNGHDGTVQILLSNGADINLCNKNGFSPLSIASFNGHDSTAQLLLSNGADINLCEENGVSPLYIACRNGHDGTVRILLSNGADINLCNKNGVSPLFLACQKGHARTAQLLLSNGADINLCVENGVSPLYIACRNRHDSTVQLLLSNGADINLCNKNGFSPLYIACQNGHDSTVLLLLSNGADINLCTKNGFSPLYIACQNGHDSTAQLLLSKGADINLCEENGASPLYVACFNGHDSTVQLLLSNGADINL